MTSLIKTPTEIAEMRLGGKILAQIYQILSQKAEVGLTTWDLEVMFLNLCKDFGVKPACKGYAPYGYPPYPAGLCVGVNNQALHNFPTKKIKLKSGDILKLDTVINYKGFYLDSAIVVPIGEISAKRKKLIQVAEQALMSTISEIKDGVKVGLLSNTMQTIAESAGYGVLRDYAGHGIGKEMHEDPTIPCYGNIKQGPTLHTGMTVCIEPLITEGSYRLKHKGYWETETLDKSDFVQVEHTVLVTKEGYEILTKL